MPRQKKSTGQLPANETIQSTNDTSNRFLGSVQRSWMNPGASGTTEPTSLNNAPFRSRSDHVSSKASRPDTLNAGSSPKLQDSNSRWTSSAQTNIDPPGTTIDLVSDARADDVAHIASSTDGEADHADSEVSGLVQSAPIAPPATPALPDATLSQTSTSTQLLAATSPQLPEPHAGLGSMHLSHQSIVGTVETSRQEVLSSLPHSDVFANPVFAPYTKNAQGSMDADAPSRMFHTPGHSLNVSPSPYPSMNSNSPSIAQTSTLSQSPSRNLRSPSSSLHPGTTNTFVAIFDQAMRKLLSVGEFGPAALIRIKWLRYALFSNDLFFLAMHQSFCLWYLQRDYLFASVGFNEHQDSGFTRLGTILGDNATLPRQLIEYCCTFINTTSMLEHDPQLRTWLVLIMRFLTPFSQRWEGLIAICRKRGTPPCAYEICQQLNCISTALTFQHLCFSVLQARLHSITRHPAFAKETENLFLQNQNTYAYNHAHGVQWSFDRVQAANEAFGFQYAESARRHGIPIVPSAKVMGPSRSINESVPSNATPRIQTTFANTVPVAFTPTQTPVPYGFMSARPHAGSGISPTTPSQPLSPSNQLRWNGSHWVPLQASGSPQLISAQSPTGPARSLQQAQVIQGTATALPSLLPHEDFRLPIMREPDPTTYALHQAHLWPRHLVPNDTSGTPFWFTYLDSFLLQPQVYLSSSVFERWEFDLPESAHSRLIKLTDSDDQHVFHKAADKIDDGSIQIRLKCIQLSSGKEIPGGWSTLPTYWPECGFFSVNGQFVEVRRKLHYKRDLPADITSTLNAGTNILQFSYHSMPHEAKKHFGIAIEVIVMSSEATILAAPAKADAKEALGSITQTLKIGDEDDDIQLVDDYISIDLTDPFTSQMFTQPARGASCLHRECFDLDTFLQTLKMQAENGIVDPDRWLCPICGRDARPKNLVIDEFLVSVRQKLIGDGQDDVRAVHVMADGSWTPKRIESAKSKGDQASEAGEPGLITDAVSETQIGRETVQIES